MAEPATRRTARHRGAVYLVFAVFLAAAAWFLYSRRHELAAGLRQLSPEAVVGSLVAGYAAIGAMLLGWAAAVRDGGVDMSLRDLTRVYAVGQVGKYIPGSVWPVLTQARLARRRGASTLRVGSGSLLALGVSVCVGLLAGGLLLPFSSHEAARRLWWVALVALPATALLWPPLLNALLSRASRLLRRGDPGLAFSSSGIAVCAAWSLLGTLLFGVHIYLLAHGLGATGGRGLLLSVCAYALASGVGVIVIFVPAGSGVREAVLTIVLAPVLSVDAALVVALVSRALLVVVDVSFGLSQVAGLRHWSAAPATRDPDPGH